MKTGIAAPMLVVASLLAGCASGPNRTAGDPLEPMNRVIFKVNDSVDRTVAVPIAKGYQKVTPGPLQTAVRNFFSNLGDLSNLANNLLQLKITDATEDLMRLTMNSVFGLGGLLDFASQAGLPKHHQDFGLTLGRWGVPAGPYLVLPLFGPSSFRDSIGFAVDVRFDLMHYTVPGIRNPLYGVEFVSARADMLGATDLLQQAALDKYSFVRDAYTQQRASRLRSGSTPATPPAYGDPEHPGDGTAAGAAGLPEYTDPGESAPDDKAAAPGAASGAGAAGLPEYTDPGASTPDKTAAPDAASGAGAATNSGAPVYSDPGEKDDSGNSGPAAGRSASGASAASSPAAAGGLPAYTDPGTAPAGGQSH